MQFSRNGLFRTSGISACLGLMVCLVFVAGCPWCWPFAGTTPTDVLSATDTFPTSLHATRPGKDFWYKTANGGFESLTGVPMSTLPCEGCHNSTARPDGSVIEASTYVPSCADCHILPGADTVAQETCIGCHSRQGNAHQFEDFHRDTLGFTCMSCHSLREMHGDGNSYDAMWSEGAIDTKCENCHTTLASNTYHDTHAETVDCSGCHTLTVVTCNNCHLESMVEGKVKRFYSPPATGFQYLVRKKSTGKVTTGSMQSLTYEGNSFYAIGPFQGHTIVKNAKVCGDCHGNAAVTQYFNDGEITVTEWDDVAGTLNGPTGVIPVPPDWATAFQLDFVDYLGDPTSGVTDPDAWVFLKHGADGTQMMFADPLTAEQMNKLR